MMILEFEDGQQITVKAILGGPRLVDGVMRDVLRVEIDPETMAFRDVKTLFTQPSKTNHLYTYGEEPDENGDPVVKKILSGEGYNHFVSISEERRRVIYPPGRIRPPEYEEIIAVCVAQMTYEEYKAAYPDADV